MLLIFEDEMKIALLDNMLVNNIMIIILRQVVEKGECRISPVAPETVARRLLSLAEFRLLLAQGKRVSLKPTGPWLTQLQEV